MRKLLALSIAALLSVGFAFAQTSSLQDPDPETVGADSAMSSLREVSIDKFEREGSWAVHISPDDGVITSRLFTGNPAMKEPLEEDEGKEDEDTQVLGVRVDFFRRGINAFTIKSGRPLPIEGTTKTISLWVCGRNQDHEMYVLVQDYFGNNYQLYLHRYFLIHQRVYRYLYMLENRQSGRRLSCQLALNQEQTYHENGKAPPQVVHLRFFRRYLLQSPHCLRHYRRYSPECPTSRPDWDSSCGHSGLFCSIYDAGCFCTMHPENNMVFDTSSFRLSYLTDY